MGVRHCPEEERPPHNPPLIRRLRNLVSRVQFPEEQRRNSKGLERDVKDTSGDLHVLGGGCKLKREPQADPRQQQPQRYGQRWRKSVERLRPGQRRGRKLRRALARGGESFRSCWSMRANPTERSRETRVIHTHRTEKIRWKELEVSNGW